MSGARIPPAVVQQRFHAKARGPTRGGAAPLAFRAEDRFRAAFLYGRVGRLTAIFFFIFFFLLFSVVAGPGGADGLRAADAPVVLGLGCIVTLYCCSSTSYHIC